MHHSDAERAKFFKNGLVIISSSTVCPELATFISGQGFIHLNFTPYRYYADG